MSENRIHRSSDASSPKKRNGNVTVRNYLIIAALVTAAIVIFVFGIISFISDLKCGSSFRKPFAPQGAQSLQVQPP